MTSQVVGVGSGRPLVLLHGWGMNSAVWSSILPQLTESYRVTLLELPGHGAEPYAEACDQLDDWVAHCLQRAPRNADWIGWSLGGQIALRAALLEPERIRRLVMVCASPRFVRAADWPAAMPEATLRQFAESLQQDHQQTLARFLALQVQGDDQAREALRLLRQEVKQRPSPQPAALEAGLELLLSIDLRAHLELLSVPSLWLLGARDALVPRALAGALHSLQIPAAEVELIAGCAHAPLLSHRAQSMALIRPFLERE
ncbi:MAG: pimeloyl-ACP methyl ester esterase BioH [Gammaproteobacteria bacterium]|nr:pimeloyl-ACP methyl ester esterase BioH [Gammaproteobacteria bacterium]